MQGCLKGIANFILGLVLLAAALAAAAWFWALPQLDTKLADAVRREFLLPPSSTVEIHRGSLLDTMEGQVESFYVESNEAQIDEVPVENLKFVAEGIEFDLPQTLLTQRAELKNMSHGRLSFRVGEKALVKRWASDLESAGLSKVEVELSNDSATVGGLINLALVKVRVGGKGKLTTDGNAIRFELEELKLGDNTFGLGQLDAVFSKLAPVLDLGQFKVGMHIDRLETGNGYIEVQATSRSLDELAREMKEAKKRRELEAESGADAETAAESESAAAGEAGREDPAAGAAEPGGSIDPGAQSGAEGKE